MQNIFNIGAFLVTILIIVGVHEWGHFAVATLCKIKVLRFSIGFGKALWRFQSKQGTEYVIALIPLGGYVKLLDEREGLVSSEERPYAFNYRPLYQRFLVILAGSFFNLLCSLLAFWWVLSMGITYVKPIIGSVKADSLVAQAGLQAREEIIAIDGHPTPHWAAIAMALIRHYGEQGKLTITVQKPDEMQVRSHTTSIDLRQWKLNALRPDPLGSLGIIPYRSSHLLHTLHYSPLAAWKPAFEQLTTFVNFNIVIVYKMVTGVISWQSLGGPLTIWDATVLAADQGLVVYINFLGLLGASIALINLLPIPGLDGAQLIYLAIEGIRRRPVSTAVQLLFFRLGLILLSLLMLQALMNDLLRFI